MNPRGPGQAGALFAGCLAALWVATIAPRSDAGAWTQPAGSLRLKLAVSHWRADQKFASSQDEQLVFPDGRDVQRGDRIPFDPITGGLFQLTALTAEVAFSPLDWLELGVNLPLIWSDFDTEPVDTVDSESGIGDVRFGAQALAYRTRRFAFAGRLRAKAPTGANDLSIYSVPIGEGQWDLELVESTGYSFYPYGYTNLELGWRFRFANSDNGRKPGDELLALAEVGFNLARFLSLKLAASGLFGLEGSIEQFDTTTKLPSKQAVILSGGLIFKVWKQLQLDLTGRAPVYGRDFPAGFQLAFGATTTIQLFDDATK